jgi:hypothetical protein
MRALGGLRSLGSSRNNPLITIGTFLVVVCLGYKTAQYILVDDLTTLELIGIVFAGGAVVVAILNDWRRGMYALVAWILFEDFVRKFLGNNMMIYFGKDILALVVYLSYFRARRGRGLEKFHVPFRVPLLLFVWFGVLQVFNPSSKSIFYGILGMKVDFIYIPLIYIGYTLLDSEDDLYRFFSYFCVLVLIVSGLGLAQSIIGPTFLNPSRLQDDIRELATLYRTAPISGAVVYRPTSVFVSASRFGDFLIVAWLVSLGFGGYLLLRRRRGRALAFTTVGAVAAASLMTGSRGVFMWNSGIALVVVAGFLWGAPWRQREALRVMRAIQRTALMVGAGIILLLTIFPKDFGSRLAFYSETLLPDSPTSELVHRTQTYPLQQFNDALTFPDWPWGYGLGTCTLGTQYVIRLMHAQPMNIGVESGYGNLLLEMGIGGLLLWIFLGVCILVSSIKVVLELKGTPWFPLSFVVAFYAAILWFPMMFTGVSAYQDFVLNAMLWLLLGMMYRLRVFPKVAALSQKQAGELQG